MKIPKTWVININALFQRATRNIGGHVTISIPAEDVKIIGNYKPIIVASPEKMAQMLAQAFSIAFKDAPVVTSWKLQCSFEEAESVSHAETVWDSVEIPSKNSYRIAIFIPEV